MALSLISLFSIILIIFLPYYYYLYQRLRFKLPPGPRPLPIVGNLYDVKPVKFRCFAEWAQVYGPIISVWMGSTLNVVISSSDLAKEVLKAKDQQLADRHRSRTVSKTSEDGQDLVWADYGPHYVKVRKVCTLDLFSTKRIEALRPIREEEVAAMVESLFNDCTNPGMIPSFSFPFCFCKSENKTRLKLSFLMEEAMEKPTMGTPIAASTVAEEMGTTQ